MIPLVEPAELEPILARARARSGGGGRRLHGASGDPADTIAGTARDWNTSRVVLRGHERSWLGRLVGSDVALQAGQVLLVNGNCSSSRRSARRSRPSTRRPSRARSSRPGGVELGGKQQTKMRMALEFFAKNLAGADNGKRSSSKRAAAS